MGKVLGPRGAAEEYEESIFLYFLDLERLRVNRSGYSLRLLLVSVEPAPGKPLPLQRSTAARVFAALRAALRETDVIGWYRQDCVAGAVLTARTDADVPEMAAVIRERVDGELQGRLRAADTRGLRVRVIELRRPTRASVH